MPAIGGRSGLLFYCLLSALLAAGNAAAQDAAYFSPTFAASRGSPYSEVYAATFGARTVGAPPLETAAPTVVVPTLVYVIQDGRLLTYSAGDYGRGGEALTTTALPASLPNGRHSSEERRVGKGGVSTGRHRWAPET